MVKNRFWFYLLMIFIAISCKERDNNIDPVFQPYVDQFFAEGIERGIYTEEEFHPLVIQFFLEEDLPTETIRGRCSSYGDGDIEINKNFWDIMDESRREMVISHEIGHCLLERPHLETLFRDCNCSSMMYPGVTGSLCVAEIHSPMWRKYYYDELFEIENTTAASIIDVDYTDWTRELITNHQDSIPSDLSFNDGESYEYRFNFKDRSLVNITTDHFELNIDFDFSDFFRISLIRDGVELNYTDSDIKFSMEPFQFRIIVNEGIIHFYALDFLFHSIELEAHSLGNVELVEGLESLENLVISRIDQ